MLILSSDFDSMMDFNLQTQNLSRKLYENHNLQTVRISIYKKFQFTSVQFQFANDRFQFTNFSDSRSLIYKLYLGNFDLRSLEISIYKLSIYKISLQTLKIFVWNFNL